MMQLPSWMADTPHSICRRLRSWNPHLSPPLIPPAALQIEYIGGAHVVGAKSLERLHIFWLCRKSYFVLIFFDLKKYEDDSLSPQKGRLPKGCILMTPPFCNLVNLMRGNRNMRDAQTAEAALAKDLKSVMI